MLRFIPLFVALLGSLAVHATIVLGIAFFVFGITLPQVLMGGGGSSGLGGKPGEGGIATEKASKGGPSLRRETAQSSFDAEGDEFAPVATSSPDVAPAQADVEKRAQTEQVASITDPLSVTPTNPERPTVEVAPVEMARVPMIPEMPEQVPVAEPLVEPAVSVKRPATAAPSANNTSVEVENPIVTADSTPEEVAPPQSDVERQAQPAKQAALTDPINITRYLADRAPVQMAPVDVARAPTERDVPNIAPGSEPVPAVPATAKRMKAEGPSTAIAAVEVQNEAPNESGSAGGNAELAVAPSRPDFARQQEPAEQQPATASGVIGINRTMATNEPIELAPSSVEVARPSTPPEQPNLEPATGPSAETTARGRRIKSAGPSTAIASVEVQELRAAAGSGAGIKGGANGSGAGDGFGGRRGAGSGGGIGAGQGSGIGNRPALVTGNRPPRYPPDALSARLEGIVMLRVVVRKDGTAADVRLHETSGVDSLDDAARAAVKDWRFVPAREFGTAVEATVIVPIRFVIRS